MIAVGEAELEDLRARLRAVRWAERWPVAGWDAGTDPDVLRRLVDYWATAYDWRAQERAINALPFHTATIDGTTVVCLRFDRAGGMPIVLTNGWPSTFLELIELARRLDGFTVVIPVLPGFPLAPQRPSLDGLQTHELWHRLMHDELGFERYAAHGSDLGAGTTSRLAEAYPESVVGIHVTSVAAPSTYDPASLSAEEQQYVDAVATWSAAEGAYQHQQSTRPLTLSYGLSDSPVGLLAWILEKYRAWSDSDGDVSTRFTDDFLLTQASLYWFTGTISTSFRPYYEYAAGFTPRVAHVDVPTAVAVFPADLAQPPRAWAERTYNVTRYTTMPRGGHFAAHEEPDLLADDITAFFSPGRSGTR
jgi:pimeloyl-ACP methyl ester carboxylesterase